MKKIKCRITENDLIKIVKQATKSSLQSLNEYLDKGMSRMRTQIKQAKDEDDDQWSDEVEDEKEIIKNEWMIHFNDIRNTINIASNGFKQGNAMNKKPEQVTYNKPKVETNFFNYAYLATDVINYVNDPYASFAIETFMEYIMNEKECSFIMFKGNGYRFYHIGDSEEQVVFNNIQPNTKVLILKINDNYCVMNSTSAKPILNRPNQFKKGEQGLDLNIHKDFNNPKNNFSNILYFSREIDKVIKWVMTNFEQYKKNLKY